MATFKRRTDNREENYLQGKAPIQGLWGGLGRSTRWTSLLQTCKIVIQGMKSFSQIAGLLIRLPHFLRQNWNVQLVLRCRRFVMMWTMPTRLPFLNNYQQSVQRGLISEEDRVGPDKMSYIATQPATMASNESSPETAGKFPGASGVKI